VVGKDSPIEDDVRLLDAYRAASQIRRDRGRLGAGGMDHLVAAMAMEAAGEDPTAVEVHPL
jgi:putative tricarboxylic transport membrane protein